MDYLGGGGGGSSESREKNEKKRKKREEKDTEIKRKKKERERERGRPDGGACIRGDTAAPCIVGLMSIGWGFLVAIFSTDASVSSPGRSLTMLSVYSFGRSFRVPGEDEEHVGLFLMVVRVSLLVQFPMPWRPT